METNTTYHKILQRQIRKTLGRNAEVPEEFEALFALISESYEHQAKDRYMLERSIDLSSKELVETNQNLQRQKQELENTFEELYNTQEQLQESEKMAMLSRELKEVNDAMLQQQEEIRAAYEELQATHEDLRATQAQLVHSEKMSSLGQLTAGVAHEINNPVNFIYAGIQAMQITLSDFMDMIDAYQVAIYDSKSNSSVVELQTKIEELQREWNIDELKQDVKDVIEDIKVGAERTAEIVRGLKNFSRSDDNAWQIVNLHEGLDSTLVILNSQTKDKVEISKEYDEGLDMVECLPGQINQVFMNILSNAVQALEGEGSIKIKTQNHPENAIVSILDNGSGIPNHILGKIFEPFFTTKDVGKGTGLGLSISYGIIEKHGGSIEVKSELEKGTEFIITIPKFAPDKD